MKAHSHRLQKTNRVIYIWYDGNYERGE